jgi:penicillin amidase
MNWKRLVLAALVAISLSCSPRPAETSEAEPDLPKLAAERLSKIEGDLKIAGLREPVEVLRDRWGIPHIYAKATEDLFFAQGFVAAQDRLYQMEIWRRTGAGELAEVFGPDLVERDRIARLVRYRGDIEAEWRSYGPKAKEIAASFAAGVNAFIRHCGDKLPVEFELLSFRPGEWEAEDSLLRIAGLLMTRNQLLEIARSEMVAKLGIATTQKLMPTDPPRRLDPDPTLNLVGLDERVLASYRAAISIPTLREESGSNNWVVDAALTTTGKPILASDPHRPVVLPSLRYIVHLNGPGWNVIGGGEPALPGVAIGHNERIAWGFTIAPYDQVDFYVEQIDPGNPRRYRFKDEWLEMTVERERVRVKGQPEPVEVELKFTRHGPVLWEDAGSNRVVALRWAGQEPGTAGYLGSLAINTAANWDGFIEAAARWKLPSENIIYADIDGTIGWIAAGLVPIRKNWSGLYPVPGSSGRYEWSGFRSVSELPQRRNPPEHYIATANHNILPQGYRHELAFDWSPPYRFQRIDELLRKGGKFTIDDFKRLQHDETSLPARELVGMLRDAPAQAEAHGLLTGWNQVLSKDSNGAALFEVWLEKLKARFVVSQAAPEHHSLIARNIQWPVLIQLLKTMPSPARKTLLAESLKEAWSEAQKLLGPEPRKWRWGALHTIEFRHPLANSAARRVLFNRGPVERGGDAFTPNATSGSNYRQASGASYRHILDLSDWDRSVFTSTPGESGQPGSRHYDDLLKLWSNGEYAPLAFTRKAVEANTAHRLMLMPAAVTD